METRVALLRGINIGGHHLIRMANLKQVFLQLGCRDVQTYIQSGNVVFRSKGIEAAAISLAIERSHGFRPDVFLLDAPSLRAIAAGNPFQGGQGNRVHFFFFHEKPTEVNQQGIEELRIASEEFHVGSRALYLHAPDGVARSKLAQGLGRCIPVSMTARNLNTVNKLLEMLGPSSPPARG